MYTTQSISERLANNLQEILSEVNKRKQKDRNAIVRTRIEFTLSSTELFVRIGKLFANSNGKCSFGDKEQSILLEQNFTNEQYERVIVPLCAAFNITNIQHGRIILGRVK